jgi:hypothetical protein
MKELLELAREYFAASTWWPVIRVVAALAIIASLIRIIFTALPGLQSLLGRVAAGLGRGVVAGATASRLALHNALTYKDAPEPRWIKPVIRWYGIVMGSVMAVFLFAYSVLVLIMSMYAPPAFPLWKRLAGLVLALILGLGTRICVVQAREAWYHRAHRVDLSS